MDNVLIAREGYVYTNGETFSDIIRLGINDNVDNWHEITEEEAERLQNTEIPPEEDETKASKYEKIIDILTGNEEG